MLQVIKKPESVSGHMCDFIAPLPERTESFFFHRDRSDVFLAALLMKKSFGHHSAKLT